MAKVISKTLDILKFKKSDQYKDIDNKLSLVKTHVSVQYNNNALNNYKIYKIYGRF